MTIPNHVYGLFSPQSPPPSRNPLRIFWHPAKHKPSRVCNNPAWPVPAPATSVTSSRNAQVNISNVHSASGPLPGENLFPPGASAVRDGSPKGTLVISPSPSAPAMSPPMERGMSDSDACSKGKPLILARRSRPLPIPPRLPLSSPSRTPDSCFNTQSAYDYWPASPSHQKTYRRLPPIPISTPLQPPFPTSPSSSVMITPPATLAGEEMPQDSCDRDILACASHALLLKENGEPSSMPHPSLALLLSQSPCTIPSFSDSDHVVSGTSNSASSVMSMNPPFTRHVRLPSCSSGLSRCDSPERSPKASSHPRCYRYSQDWDAPISWRGPASTKPPPIEHSPALMMKGTSRLRKRRRKCLFSEPCGTVAADIWTSAITPWADVETDVTSEAFADIDVLVVGKSVLSVDRGVVVTTPSKDGIWKEKDIEEVIPKLRELKAWKARNKLRR